MREYTAPSRGMTRSATLSMLKRWSVAAGLALAACAPAAPQRATNVTITPVPLATLPAIRIPDQAITFDTMARIAPLARLGSGGTRQLLPSPNGQRLAIVAEAGVHVYDAARLSPQHATTYLDNMSVTDAAFSPTGETLAVARSGGTYVSGHTSFVLLDATSGQELRRWDDPATGYAEHLALAPHGERFAATLFDIRSSGQIAIVNAQSGQIERTVPMTRPEGRPFALHFLANGRLLFSQGEGLATLDPAGQENCQTSGRSGCAALSRQRGARRGLCERPTPGRPADGRDDPARLVRRVGQPHRWAGVLTRWRNPGRRPARG